MLKVVKSMTRNKGCLVVWDLSYYWI